MDANGLKNPKAAMMTPLYGSGGGGGGTGEWADAPTSLFSVLANAAALAPSLMNGPLPSAQPLSLMTIAPKAPAFVTSPNGTIDWGMITPEIAAASNGALKSAPIRVQQGDYDQFGMAHVSADKMRRLQRLGFSSLDDFLDHVANNFNLAVQQPNGRVGLVVSPGKGMRASNDPAHNYMAVELQDNGGHYGMTTIIPDAKSSYLSSGGKQQIWKQGAEPAD